MGSSGQAEGEPPINTRGTVDQDSLLDEIEQPRVAQDHDRRFVLVSETLRRPWHAYDQHASGPSPEEFC